MRTFIILAGGFALLAVFTWLGRGRAGRTGGAKAAFAFIPLWFALAGINMAIGVVQAGYTVAEEAPIFLLLFVPPAALALFLWKKWH